MQKEFKKAKLSILPPLLAFILILIFFALNLYGLYKEYLLVNLIVEIFLGIALIIPLFFIFSFLLTPSKPLWLDDNYLEVRILNKKITLKYDDIFTVYHGGETVLTASIFVIYLKDGRKIKIKYLKEGRLASMIIYSKLDHNFFIDKVNLIHKFFIRIFNLLTSFFERFLGYKPPKKLEKIEEIVQKYKEKGIKKVFIVKYNHLDLKLIDKIFENSDISYFVFDKSIPNPTNEIVLEAKNKYIENNCDAILAIGGGSVIDLAKALGVSINNNKSLDNYAGLLKVKKKTPLLIAIPTTPASGSEVTWASVIVFGNKKCSITSPKIIPSYFYVGEEFISSLSKENLINSVMDALTHAIEAYLNVFKNKKYDVYAVSAIKLIYENLENAIENNDINAKLALFDASSIAGLAFSIKGVGNVHALSHALSYKYNLPHAKTNGIILPTVLKTYIYNKNARKKMAFLAKDLNISKESSSYNQAKDFINYIDLLVKKYKLDVNIKEIQKDDINFLAKHAKKEAVPLYGTPILYSKYMYSYMFLNLFSYYKKKEKK